jgi:uridine kinase
MARSDEVIELVADISLARLQASAGPIRIGVDGRDGAGKTTFADLLAVALAARGAETYRASIDDWQQPATYRYRRGRYSAEGYYRDGFDHLNFRDELLLPFAEGGRFRLVAFDVGSDRSIESPSILAGPVSILLVDGVFLLRPELRDYWELGIYLYVDRPTALERGIARDSLRSGDADLERRLYLERYGPGQDLYELEASPSGHADLVIDNTLLSEPVLVHRRN